jgi:peptidoglycan hydrolase-like protein with peptidoglycan-binding domain
VRIRKLTTGTIAALTGLVLAGGMLATAAPASANTNDGYVSGAGGMGDDWGDEGTISTTSYSSSTATCLWQQVLHAEGLLSASGIDGHFGPNTRTATENFQARYSDLENDGKAGPATWGKADNKFTQVIDYVDGSARADYDGRSSNFRVYRNTQGRHFWWHAGDGANRTAAYRSNSC